MSVEVEGKSQLLLICDYLEKAGLIETARALQAEAGIQSTTPGLATVRRLALDGKWRELEKALLSCEREGEEHEPLQKAKYSLAKQQYLEAVAGLDAISSYREPSTDELGHVQGSLERLEQLAPSKKEFATLEALLDPQTDFFDGWDLQKSRKETCNVLLEYSRRQCFRDRGDIKKEEKQAHLLTLLLAKGKIYEECEQVFHKKCSKRDLTSADGSTLLDIGSWLQRQPDVVFQAAPSRMKVVSTTPPTRPHSSTSSESRTEVPLSSAPSDHRTGNSRTETAQEVVGTRHPTPEVSNGTSKQPHGVSEMKDCMLVMGTQLTVGREESKPVKLVGAESTVLKSAAEAGSSDGDCSQSLPSHTARSSPMQRSMRERITEHRDQVEMATNRVRVSLRETTGSGELTEKTATQQNQLHQSTEKQPPLTAQTITTHTSPPSLITQAHPLSLPPPPPPPTGVDSQPPIPTLNDNFCHPSWLLQTTPLVSSLQREGRNSSTPKPSTHHLPCSPSTSPVPHVPAAGSQATPTRQDHRSSERKQIDFDQEATDSHRSVEKEPLLSVSWPTASLIGKVTDTQAVRAVAFSESGQMVAVGANSKCLRLFATDPILDTDRGEEMSVLQEYPRYHRGSIYCLAWLGDSLLASGSNDKAIKLLSCQSNSETISCDPRGRMNFHEGTVRELVFLSNGQLASGGSGNPSLLISDCETMKLTCTLSGHTKQVLAVVCGDHGSTVVSGGEDKTVKLWDWSAGKCVYTLSLSDSVTSLSAHAHHLGVALGYGGCAVYDVRNWKLVSCYQAHTSECRSVRHSPCGKWLLTGSYDGSVCLGEAAGSEWMEVAQHGDKVIQTRWHPQGQLFASTSTDKTACFWTL